MSRIPGFLQPTLGELITSHRTRSLKRHAHALAERATRRSAAIEFYHDAGDPWSGLLTGVLTGFRERFDIPVRVFTVDGVSSPFRPESERFRNYALRDAQMLARFHGLPIPRQLPARGTADCANAILAGLEHDSDAYLQEATAIHERLFLEGDQQFTEQVSETPSLNRERLEAKGHYLSGTLFYRGEWFWGIDRLPLLEQVLRKEGRGNGTALFTYPEQAETWEGDTLECFFSFRSPYSYIALPRLFDLADRYDLNLKLKPLLPMVNRGIALPDTKREYILLDSAREAHRRNVVFGRIRDPLGKGVENAIAVFHSLSEDHQRQFVWSAMNGSWARGLNLADRTDLAKVAREAGLDRWQMDEALSAKGWQELAEHNRMKLNELGLWGVPSFRMGSRSCWGQDRLELIRAGVARARAQES